MERPRVPGFSLGPDRPTSLAFVTVVVLGGLNAIAVKQTVAELAPFWSAAVRFLAAGLILLAIVVVARRPLPRGRSLSGGILYGVVAFGASFGCVNSALREIPAATGIIFLALVPLLTFGLAILHRQERFRVQGLLGAVLAIGGVAVVVADQLGAAVPLGPMLLMSAGAVFIAEGAVILKAVPRSDPFATNAVAMLAGGLALLGISVAVGEPQVAPTATTTWVWLGYVVVPGSVVMFGLYLYAIRRWTASAVSYVTLLMPLVTVPVAAAMFSERVSPAFIVGGAIALAGVYVGAFLAFRPGRSSAAGLADGLPIDAPGDPARAAAGRGDVVA